MERAHPIVSTGPERDVWKFTSGDWFLGAPTSDQIIIRLGIRRSVMTLSEKVVVWPKSGSSKWF